MGVVLLSIINYPLSTINYPLHIYFMENKKSTLRFGIIALIVLMVGMTRLLHLPANVAPISAFALFGGAYFSKRWQSVLLPIIAFWLSDLVLNNVVYKEYFPTFTWFSSSFYFSAISLLLIAAVSWFMLKVIKGSNVILSSLMASSIFFIISNFGVWISSDMYPKTSGGLMACYVAGLPFLQNTIQGDLLWSAILFGGFALAQRRFPVLATV
jgi:hypothetical protein